MNSEFKDQDSQSGQPSITGGSSAAKRSEISKRVIALLVDLITCYIVATMITAIISFVPFVGKLINQQIILILLFMLRDYFFSGRGIGKNLMGLQVVASRTGQPLNIHQSLLRNLTLTFPLILLELTNAIPSKLLIEPVHNVLNIIEAIYAIIVLPLESYRAYSREDGLRLGDELAHTRITESQTNFDHLLPRHKN